MSEGYSEKARRSASLARSIKRLLGKGAYEAYKRTGKYDKAALDKARKKKSPPKKHKPRPALEPPTQADVKPDTAPTHDPSSDSFLRSLQVGEIVRDSTDQRVRVQKTYSHGLRIRDQRDGARDITWDQARHLGLRREEAQPEGKGPAARRLGELRHEAEQLGINTTKLRTTKELEIAIGEIKVKDDNALAQVDPQLASDSKDLQDFDAEQPWRSERLHREFWNNDNWVAEEKLDGVRLKMHIGENGIRTDSRRRDTKTRRFSEKSPNFQHLMALDIPELEGTVIDAEGMIPAESGTLPSGVHFNGSLAVSTAATNAGPQTSYEIQQKFGPMQFWAFDILQYKGEDVTGLPTAERRKLLERTLGEINAKYPPAEEFIHLTAQAEGDDKLPFYEDIISKGGEGIIFKDQRAKYAKGKRAKSWMKLKRFQDTDAYVTGFIPGEAGNEGLVGALELAVKIDGKEVPIAAVSQFTEEERKNMTNPDGKLKREYYGRVLTFRGQQLTKRGRFRHAVFVTWREDKNKDEVDGYEVKDELIKLGVLEDPAAKSEHDKKVVDDRQDKAF